MRNSLSIRPPETAREAQGRVHASLAAIFSADQVTLEWTVRQGATDAFSDIALYAPRLDIAVGPFNVTRENSAADAGRIAGFEQHPLMESLRQIGLQQHRGEFYTNRNPRCLISVEIEFHTSSKHILGAITNSSMLGLIGVVLGSSKSFAKIERIGAFARTLRDVGKTLEGLFTNVVYLEVDEFIELLSSTQIRFNCGWNL